MNCPLVTVVLHVGVGLHDLRVPADEAEPPADHVETLRHRVHLDADLLRPVHLEEAERLAPRSSAGCAPRPAPPPPDSCGRSR